MEDRISHWKYKVGDTVVAGCFEDMYTIQHQTADISTAQRFYIVGGMGGQETKCAHEFEANSNLVPND